MYPAGELKGLAQSKARLQARIRLRRLICASNGRRVATSVDKVDQWRQRLQRWRGILPLVVPFALFRNRSRSKIGLLLRWAPIAVRAYQGWRNFATSGARRNGIGHEAAQGE